MSNWVDFELGEFPFLEQACHFCLQGARCHSGNKMSTHFLPDILFNLLSVPSFCFYLHKPCLITQAVMHRASSETILSPVSLQRHIRSKEPVCTHANEAE